MPIRGVSSPSKTNRSSSISVSIKLPAPIPPDAPAIPSTVVA
jgi:hypothetical protein